VQQSACEAVENRPMPILALGLVLVAALLHALWNIVAKHAGGNRHFALVCGLMLAMLWLPVALWAGIGAAPGRCCRRWVRCCCWPSSPRPSRCWAWPASRWAS
jgi:hypothetical protein